ncbi:aminoacyl-tRNA hydrolase [Methylobacillus gramineus]|uniref:aminoacyl-tRNA hydrolase n=1 Tax=Methylobacillus gramineus TaxID=755169 RepID=UPI001CFFB5DA|nr:aminoacyl-tRNA hydrolase [Methylobacillus gramineus]MCB5184992.1 aminoacyl-tRNA hydrolase [Methylobacillus gramineus]
MTGIKLFVGLGNPGDRYEDTRHNAGFWWIDQVCAETSSKTSLETKFFGHSGRLNHGQEAWLLKPTTFMNASGRSVAALARFYKIPVESILVIHDELDLPPGTARLKKGGGHGGHNGLKDIAACLGTNDFWRLRLGIGHPGDRHEVVNFVLKAPLREEMQQIEYAMDDSTRALPLLLDGKFEEAMLKLHTKPKQN